VGRLRSFGRSDVGRRREINEDAFFCDDALGLYLVADGVGGHAKGEVASAEAVEQIHDFVAQARDVLSRGREELGSPERREEVRRLLEGSLQSACYIVFSMAELDPAQRGMSTTMSALLVSADFAVTAQVGDSRIYRVRDGSGVQLTEDHTLLNYKIKKGEISADEARHMRGKNVITRAVGHKDYVEVDTRLIELKAGDRYLLCSDGLHGYLNDGELEKVLADGPIDDAPARFIELANMRGGKDNVTVVIVCID
jgi:serine/threonine protein phosphatase PrpC